MAYADLALADLDLAITLGVGQQSVLKQAYTQRAILKKLKGKTDAALGMVAVRSVCLVGVALSCIEPLCGGLLHW